METRKEKENQLIGEGLGQDNNIFVGKELHTGPPPPTQDKQSKEDFARKQKIQKKRQIEKERLHLQLRRTHK
jgi:hypothetical protein